ncbi:MAG TPA: SURF1 family protein [Burkholderiales bacterium]|nr:SURF1 family protein [Burkholderiales bacterium]
MPAGYSFSPRGWPLALAAAACAAGIALGSWQARRGEEKRALGAELDQALKAAPIEISTTPVENKNLILKRVAARGEFVAERTLFLDNKIRHGRVGYEVITPFRLSRSALHVLVNRGWVEASPSRDVLPQVRTPAGETRVEGLALERLPHALQLKENTQGRVRQNVDLGAFAADTGLALQPIVIEQRSDSGDALLREWPRPDAGIERHEGYALQWYSLAALAVVLALVLSFRRDPNFQK